MYWASQSGSPDGSSHVIVRSVQLQDLQRWYLAIGMPELGGRSQASVHLGDVSSLTSSRCHQKRFSHERWVNTADARQPFLEYKHML
jgi:hypothetical protein